MTGLEECVNRILNLDAVPPAMPTPFSCSQCGTDFTPTWKWDKAAKGKLLDIPEHRPDFVAATHFDGEKEGYVFNTEDITKKSCSPIPTYNSEIPA